MRFLHLFIFFSFLTSYTCAQVSDSAGSTIVQNQKWLEELKKLTVKEQVEKINERLNAPKLNWDGHPLFVVDGVPIDIETSEEAKKLTTMLSKAEKVSIMIMDEKTQSKTLFCRTPSAVILIQTNDRDSEKNNIH